MLGAIIRRTYLGFHVTKEEILDILEKCQNVVNVAARSGKLKGISFLDDKTYLDADHRSLEETANELYQHMHPAKKWGIKNTQSKEFLSQMLPGDQKIWTSISSDALTRPKKAQTKMLIAALDLENCKAVKLK